MTAPNVPVSDCTGVVWPALSIGGHAWFFAVMRQLAQSEWWSGEELERRQMSQLGSLCEHAARTVPFYGERLAGIAVNGAGGLTLDKFREIPILTRAELQAREKDLFSRALPKDHLPLLDVMSSGSTGRPVKVKLTAVTRLFSDAVTLRYHQWFERDFSAKTCAVRIISSERSGTPTGWVPGYRSGPMLEFDVGRTIPEQLDWLIAEAPAYLLTYPTNLAALLRHSESSGKRIPGLRQVTTMSEILDDDTRAECERIWRLTVVDAYSAREVGTIAVQCPELSGYHVMSECLLVEIIDENGAPCGPGEIGRVVVTDLHNFALPLIRYEIGDYAEVGEPCGCGRGLPVLNRILGRTRNMLVQPDGRRIWPQFGANRVARIAPVIQSQLVQISRDEIQANLVVSRPLTKDEENAVRDLFASSLGASFTIGLNYVDEIPRSAGGKFEDFRSEIAD